MPTEPQQLIQTIYRAFNARDIETVLAALHPAVDWPNGMEGGRIAGRDNVRQYWLRQWGMVNPNVDPVRITAAEDGRVVVDVHQVVRDLSGNILMDVPIQHVYSFKDDLVVRMDIREVA